jgi:6-phosphofructokinase
MSAAKPFADAGINCIGVPKTIDNDLYGTDLTFGFQTAVRPPPRRSTASTPPPPATTA